MNIIKSANLPNGNLLNVVNVAGSAGGRKWGIWRNVYVVETKGPFTGSRRKNVAKIHNSHEYDARSNKATNAAHKCAEEVFEHVFTTAELKVRPAATQ
jgi:hypothetical protein